VTIKSIALNSQAKKSDITLSVPQKPCVFSGDINQVFG